MGDFNVVVGEGKKKDGYLGHYALGYGNDHGQMLVDICKTITNIWYTQDRRPRYTWMNRC